MGRIVMRHLSSIYGNGSVRGESMENKHSVTMDKSNSIARTNKNNVTLHINVPSRRRYTLTVNLLSFMFALKL